MDLMSDEVYEFYYQQNDTLVDDGVIIDDGWVEQAQQMDDENVTIYDDSGQHVPQIDVQNTSNNSQPQQM